MAAGWRPTDREADPISEHRVRPVTRVGSVDARARRSALAMVRPSPARLDAPEPDVWLPIDLTAELEALDLTGELELLWIEEGRESFDRELEVLEAEFWRAAESAHPFLTGALPGGPFPADTSEPAPSRSAADAGAVGHPASPVVPGEHQVAADPGPSDDDVADLVGIEPLPVPEEYAALAPTRPAIAGRRRALRLRRRLVATALVVVVGIAAAGAGARMLGGTPPRRDVTVAVDGQASTIVTRAGTVGDLLASEGIVVGPGDRVVPSVSTHLRQGLAIRVVRSFPLVVDVDGTVSRVRTTRHSLASLRRELELPKALVRIGGDGPLARGDKVVLRTPHGATLVVDGTTTVVEHSTALTVGELLAARKITVGPNDEVVPPAGTRLTEGMSVQVIRVLPGQVVEDQVIPFPTQYRDDPNLSAGHSSTIQAGKNGLAHVVSDVVKKDGVVVQWSEASRVVVRPPVPQILARGTKRSGSGASPSPPAASGRSIGGGYATWYRSHAGAGACAHLTLPFGTIVKLVANNGRTAECRVGDRGPQAWTGNSIDLNPDVFSQLAPLGTGRIYVKMFVVG